MKINAFNNKRVESGLGTNVCTVLFFHYNTLACYTKQQITCFLQLSTNGEATISKYISK